MKYLGVVVLIVISYVSMAYSRNNIWGANGPDDVILFRNRIIEPSSYNEIVTKDVSYPPSGEDHQQTITAIHLTDFHNYDNGGYATLPSGGPGQSHCTVHFVSALGYSVNYLMEVYGRRN